LKAELDSSDKIREAQAALTEAEAQLAENEELLQT